MTKQEFLNIWKPLDDFTVTKRFEKDLESVIEEEKRNVVVRCTRMFQDALKKLEESVKAGE